MCQDATRHKQTGRESFASSHIIFSLITQQLLSEFRTVFKGVIHEAIRRLTVSVEQHTNTVMLQRECPSVCLNSIVWSYITPTDKRSRPARRRTKAEWCRVNTSRISWVQPAQKSGTAGWTPSGESTWEARCLSRFQLEHLIIRKMKNHLTSKQFSSSILNCGFRQSWVFVSVMWCDGCFLLIPVMCVVKVNWSRSHDRVTLCFCLSQTNGKNNLYSYLCLMYVWSYILV